MCVEDFFGKGRLIKRGQITKFRDNLNLARYCGPITKKRTESVIHCLTAFKTKLTKNFYIFFFKFYLSHSPFQITVLGSSTLHLLYQLAKIILSWLCTCTPRILRTCGTMILRIQIPSTNTSFVIVALEPWLLSGPCLRGFGCVLYPYLSSLPPRIGSG